jgi:hypothetical protein
MNNFSAGDIIINECMLTSDPGNSQDSQGIDQGGSLDISRHVDYFEIYHSIMKPYVALKMQLIDTSNILDGNGGITGNNSISLSFNQPGQEPYEATFKVTSVHTAKPTMNQRSKIYFIVAYSKHMSNLPVIERSYKNVTALDAVQDLIKTYMKPEKELDIRAPSKGMVGNENVPFTVNGIQVHKAIRSLLLRAYSTKDESSAYMIFEDSKKIVIDTLENMVNTARQECSDLTDEDDTFFYKRVLGHDFATDVKTQQTNIVAMKEHTRVDSTRTAQSSQQATNIFDLFTGEFKTIKNKFDENGKKTEGGTPTINNNIPYNTLRPPTHAKDFMASRKYIASVADSQDLTIHVPFNSSVEVGKGIKVDLPKIIGDAQKAEDDPLYEEIDGVLLVSEICHRVSLRDKKMQGTTTMRGIGGPKKP